VLAPNFSSVHFIKYRYILWANRTSALQILGTNVVEFLCICWLPSAVIYLFWIIFLPKRSLKMKFKSFGM
jgi:homoserine trans-succinylase